MAPYIAITQSIQTAPNAKPLRLRGVVTSPALFRVLAVEDADGRQVTIRDDVGAQVVVADRLRRVGAVQRPGDVLILDGTPHTVAAVMAPGFWFPDSDTEYWLPILPETPSPDEEWHAPIVGRLARGADARAATSEIQAVFEDSGSTRSTAAVRLLSTEVQERAAPALRTMQVAIGLLLILTTGNAAWLLAARATSRRDRFALMGALGAPLERILRTQLIEALWLALMVWPMAMVLAWTSIHYIIIRAAPYVPSIATASNAPATAAVGSAAALALGPLTMLPALWIAVRATRGRHALHLVKQRGAAPFEVGLMIVQSSVVVALAMQAVALGLGLRALMDENVGFGRTDNVVARFSSSPGTDPAGLVTHLEKLQAAFAAHNVPVAAVNANPLSDREQLTSVTRSMDGQAVMVGLKTVTPNYFRVVGVEPVEGRILSEGDEGRGFVLINETAARFLFGSTNVTGRSIGVSLSDWTIVGVVESVRHRTLFEDRRPEMYVLYRDVERLSARAAEIASARFFVIARDTRGTGRTIELIRSIASSVLPDATFESATHFRSLLLQAAGERPALVEAVSAMSATTLIVMIAGLYAMLSQAVTRRSREIAIRMSLGATPGRIAADRLQPAIFIWGAATALGIVLFIWVDRLVDVSLVAPAGMPKTSLLVIAALASSILLVALVAAALRPLQRAVRVQPGLVLKAD